MSYENFEKAMELAKTLPDYKIYDCCNDEAMDDLEDYLGFELSKQHYELLQKGCLSYPGNFIISNFKNSHNTGMDIIGFLETDKKYGLKVDKKFVPSPDEFIIFEQTNQDLGDFLLEMFNEIKENIEE